MVEKLGDVKNQDAKQNEEMNSVFFKQKLKDNNTHSFLYKQTMADFVAFVLIFGGVILGTMLVQYGYYVFQTYRQYH